MYKKDNKHIIYIKFNKKKYKEDYVNKNCGWILMK